MSTHDDPPRQTVPRPGDLWRTPVECDEIAGWVIITGEDESPGGGEDRRWLVVPADGFATVGTRDIAVRGTEDHYPLVLRCAWATWVRSGDLWVCEAPNRVSKEALQRARDIAEEAEPRASPLREYRESSQTYKEWIEDVLAPEQQRLEEWKERRVWSSRDAEPVSPPEGKILPGPWSTVGHALAAEGSSLVAESEEIYREYLMQEPKVYSVDLAPSGTQDRLQVITSVEGAMLRLLAESDESLPRAFGFDRNGNRHFLSWSRRSDAFESAPLPWDGDSIRLLLDRDPMLELWIRRSAES